jgi:hypothetical protein
MKKILFMTFAVLLTVSSSSLVLACNGGDGGKGKTVRSETTAPKTFAVKSKALEKPGPVFSEETIV